MKGIALILFSFASSAGAAPLRCSEGNLLRYPIEPSNPVIYYYIDGSAAAVRSEIKAAFQAWTDVDTAYIIFSETGDQSRTHIFVRASGQSEHTFIDDRYGDGRPKRQELDLGKLELNMDRGTFVRFLVHEFGHFAGLGHSTVRGTIMSYRSSAGNMTLDDKMALSRLYPNDRNYNTLPPGCATIQNTSNSDDFRGPSFGLLVLTLVLTKFLFLLTTRKFVVQKRI